ncbi:MAG: GNAT family N-acetyltransferase [Firmicutes bacterium]|nr:GNAT family N-acetyltransferase [Bacillota bacterium]MTI70371.1 GNAT family N-acetyltransferase [Bacillota bacterium]
MKTVYETDRLLLKVLDESYNDIVLDYYLRNKDFLKEWEPKRSKLFFTLDYQYKLLKRELDSIYNKNSLRLWIFKKGEEKTIGCIGFNNIVRGAFLSCFLGYKLDKDELNKGYITEAIKMGIDIMFNKYKLHRIEANILPRNKASIRVCEKLRFVNEGISRKYLKINGVWEDHIHMVLLNEEIE